MTGIILLAAGSSSRLGEPKQLLVYEGKTLIRRVVEAALAIPDAAIIIVTGAQDEKIRSELAGFAVTFAFNPNWESGMGSSVHCGMKALLSSYPDATGVLLTVTDQPFVSATLFNGLLEKALASGAGIVASAYAGTLGTPAFFNTEYFPELLALQGPEGAKKLLTRHADTLSALSFPAGQIDIDTREDYEKLLKSSGL